MYVHHNSTGKTKGFIQLFESVLRLRLTWLEDA
jgi:hypothetical protein